MALKVTWLLAARRLCRLLGWNDQFVQSLTPGHGKARCGKGEKMGFQKIGVLKCVEWEGELLNLQILGHPIFLDKAASFLVVPEIWNHDFGTKDVNNAQTLLASPKQDESICGS